MPPYHGSIDVKTKINTLYRMHMLVEVFFFAIYPTTKRREFRGSPVVLYEEADERPK